MELTGAERTPQAWRSGAYFPVDNQVSISNPTPIPRVADTQVFSGSGQFVKSIADDWQQRAKELDAPAELTVERGVYSQRQFKKPPSEPAVSSQRVVRPSSLSMLRRSRLVGRPVPRSRTATETAVSRGGGGGLWSM